MIVDYLQTLIEKYDTDNQCGFCWNFIYARKDYANIQPAKDKEHCIQFVLEYWKLRNIRVLTDDVDYTSQQEYQFRIFVGINSKLDIQYHNELQQPTDEGKYELYIKKIEDCLIDNFEVDVCEDPLVRLNTWEFEPKINKYDDNFDGGYLTGTLIFLNPEA